MVACNKLVVMVGGSSDTSTIGKRYTIFKDSYAAIVTDETVNSIVLCSG